MPHTALVALSGPSGPRTTQIGLHSSLRLTCLPCLLEGRLKVPLGLESWDSLWNREELVSPWGCSSGLLQGCMTPRVLRYMKGQGRSYFGGICVALFFI